MCARGLRATSLSLCYTVPALSVILSVMAIDFSLGYWSSRENRERVDIIVAEQEEGGKAKKASPPFLHARRPRRRRSFFYYFYFHGCVVIWRVAI